jgi:hypothetical protein
MADLTGMLQAAAGAAGDDEIVPIGVDYDGTNDYLSRATDLTGNSDGKTFTFSAWIYETSGNSKIYHIDNGSGATRFQISFDGTGASSKLEMTATNPSGTTVLNIDSPTSNLSNNTWQHILISIDLTNASNRYIYINDVSQSVTWNTYSNDNIDFTSAYLAIGAATYSGGVYGQVKGRLAGVYLDYTYRDLSIEANRRLFIDDDGLYVTPPTTGIISVPMDDPADPGRNDGTGGNFTLNGVVARSGRGPNQYNAAASTFDGSVDFLSKSNLLQGINGRYCTCSFLLNPNTQTTVADYSGSFSVQHDFNKKINIRYSPVNDVLDQVVTSNTFPYNKWIHVCFSFDSEDAQNTFQLFVNGVQQTVSGNFNDRTSNTFGFETFNVAKYAAANNKDISDFWFTLGTAIDFSADNPFYDTETGKPKFLGATGELPTGSAPLIYLPLYASSAGTNLGTGGNFTVNSGPYVGARGPSEFWADSAAFNGSNQYLNRTSALSGISDGTNITLAFSFKVDVVGSGDGYLIELHNGSSRSTGINCFFNDGSDNFSFSCFNTSATGDGNNYVFSGNSASNSVVAGAWNTVLISANASNAYIYFNGTSLSLTTSLGSNINLDLANWGIGRRDDNGTLYLDGNIGFLYFNNSYIDFSQEANRLKFFDAFNNPVDVGADGSVPTGNQPLIYMNEGFHLGTNLGSGGNFTPQNTPTDGGYVNG